MQKIPGILIIILLAAGAAAASDQTDVMAPVQQFVDGFNKGDSKAIVAACTDQASIIDEFPPHAWQGAGACSAWVNDFQADAKKNGITEGKVILGKPRHIDITADRAYVVVPASFTFKENGKPMEESGSTFTLVVQKGAAGWRISAWAWAKQ